jgi:sugar lactone lactonase YvrE
MKRSLLIVAAIAALLVLVAAPAQAGAAPAQPWHVATLPGGDPEMGGSFAGSMTAVANGDLFVSLTIWNDSNTGQVWRVSPPGTKALVASWDLGPYGALMGITHDSAGRIYVADAVFDGVNDSIVYRVGSGGSLRPVAYLPPEAWPNGLAYHDGYLFATDSALGAVWRIPLGGSVVKPAKPWFQCKILSPVAVPPAEGEPGYPYVRGIGANGLAFRGGSMYVNVSDFGRIVRIPMLSNGKAGKPSVLCERDELRTADNMAFDVLGNLWVTVNMGPTSADQASGALFKVSSVGVPHQVAVDPSWFDYPTEPVFGTTKATATTLFVANGAYLTGGQPNVIGLNVGVKGQLP